MYRFYLAAVDILPGALLLAPFYLVLHKVYLRDTGKSILYYLFSCYLAVVYLLVGLPNVTYIRPEVHLNLIPIAGMIADWKNSILNILLFVPLGLALPILWRRFKNAGHTVCFGFAMSMCIELLQILTFRATDVNDLITNTCGTYLGFLCAKMLQRRFSNLSKLAQDKTSELGIVLAIVFPAMFFVYPFVSMAFWDFILT